MNASKPSTDLGSAPIRALIGPTAAGKSALALAVAESMPAEIVSLDSMQLYRRMDIGTAKPSPSERARVRHHMIDLVEADERYDVQRFLHDLAPVLADIARREKHALFVGGTGFYLKILLDGLFEGPDVDPMLRADLMARALREGNAALHAELARVDPPSASRIHPNDTKRLVRGLEVFLQTGRPLSAWQTQWGERSDRDRKSRRLVGLDVEAAVLDRRIAARARRMLASGWPAEAASIRADPGFGPTAIQALGYAEALLVHDGALDVDAAAAAITQKTRQFARRQRTWYRHFPDVTWLQAHAGESEQRDAHEDLVAAALRAFG